MTARPAALVVAYALVTASCAGSPVAPNECDRLPEITLQSVTPPSGTAVHEGERVDIEFAFSYSSCHDGRVFVSIHDQNERSVPVLPDAGGFIPNVTIPVGIGRVTLVASVIVPSGPTRLSVHGTFQYVGIRGGTTRMFTATYPVID